MNRFNFWHHLVFTVILSLFLLQHPLPIAFTPWNSFQVLICKKSSPIKALLFHFILGLYFSMIGSSLKLGSFSLILCLNYLTLLPFKRSFIDDRVLASGLFAALFGCLFSLGEFSLYQIFFSDIPFKFSHLFQDLTFKLMSDFFLSTLIFSWLYLINFMILQIKRGYLKWQEKQKELKHAQ